MTNKLKVPCCVILKGLNDYQVLEIEDIFVKLGAEVCDSVEVFTPNCWIYYGVDNYNTTQFYDCRGHYSEDDIDSDVTLYTLEELRALVVGNKDLQKGDKFTIKELPEDRDTWYKSGEVYTFHSYCDPIHNFDVEGRAVVTQEDVDKGYKIGQVYILEEDIIPYVAAPELQSDGWIEWKGEVDHCPVPNGTLCRVKFRDGEECQDIQPEWWSWLSTARGATHMEDRDIIAYRVIAEQEALGDVSDQPATTVLPEADSSCNQGKSLIEVVRHLSYTVTIKGVKFELTDEEYMELVNELRNEM